MRIRGLTTTVLVVVVALSLGFAVGCKPSKEKCEKLYPPPQQPVGPVPGPDGPIIIIKPDQANTTLLDVHVGGQLQTPDPAISVFANYPNCELRGDFIGVRAKKFEFYTVGTTNPVNGTDVSMQSTTHRIDVVKTAYNTFHWRFQELTGQQRSCSAMPVGGFAPGKVPIEFKDLLSNTLQDSVQGAGSETDIQAILP